MSFQVYIDWAKNGAYGAGLYGAGLYGGVNSIDVVTDLVRPKLGVVTAEYGRDQSTALAPTIAGRGSAVLSNRDRRFSPRNTASPLYGYLKPARPVFITRTVGATAYVLFAGHTDDNPINPDLSTKTVQISLVDWLADFRGQNISTPLYRGVRTGAAIGYVLDAVGWPTALRDIDPGATFMPYWWEDNTDGLSALEKIVRSEGPPALLTIGPSGEIIFKDRHHRLIDTNALTSQQTWRSAGTVEPVMQVPFDYDEAWKNIVNTGTEEVGVRQPSEETAVWTSDAIVTLTSGEQRIITASASDPFFNAITPVVDIDYTLISGSVAVALTRTSGSSVGIVLTSTGPSVISGLQLRATPCPVSYTVQISASDTESINDYGQRSFPSDLPWCNEYDADAVLSNAVALRAQPSPVVTARFQIAPDSKATLLLTRDLSDKVTINEPETALLGAQFYVESISHEVADKYNHIVSFGLEAVPATLGPLAITDSTDPLAWTDSGKTAFAVDDPATIAITDSTNPARYTDAGRTAT